jgi:hypothetical protein
MQALTVSSDGESGDAGHGTRRAWFAFPDSTGGGLTIRHVRTQ